MPEGRPAPPAKEYLEPTPLQLAVANGVARPAGYYAIADAHVGSSSDHGYEEPDAAALPGMMHAGRAGPDDNHSYDTFQPLPEQ